MPTLTLTWHTMPGHTHCPLCEDADGQQWTIPLGVGQFPDLLFLGDAVIWDCVADHSVAHETAQVEFPCYCYLTATPDFSDLENDLSLLAVAAKTTLAEISEPPVEAAE